MNQGIQTLFGSRYFYDGVPRLAYFWSNPNFAGAVLVTLLPFFWALRYPMLLGARKPVRHVVVAAIELFWGLLVGWTCSRGALVAWVVALAAFWWMKARYSHQSRRSLGVFVTTASVFFLVALLTSGTGHRFMDIADGDRSALNRLGIWANALRLVHGAPLSGWGLGNSGNALVQWFEPISSTKEHAAVVGSYLHIGAELGLPILMVLLALLLMTLHSGFEAGQISSGWRNMLVSGATAGFMAFATAALFSTIWTSVTTVGVAIMLALVIWFLSFAMRTVRVRGALICLVLAAALVGVTYLCSHALARDGFYIVRKTLDGVVLKKNRKHSAGGRVSLLVDRLVLGDLYGRQIRRLAEGVDRWQEIHVYSGQAKSSDLVNEEVVIFGPRITDITKEILESSTIVCPSVAYERERHGTPKMLILPEYDEFGFHPGWLGGVAGKTERLSTLEGVGQDCTRRMPELITHFAKEVE